MERIVSRSTMEPTLRQEIASAVAMCNAALAVRAVKAGAAHPSVLAERTAAYMSARNRAYAAIEARPKHHYALHLPDQVLRDSLIMLDCFVRERKRQDVKAWGDLIFDENLFTHSLLSHAIWQQVNNLKNFKGNLRLRDNMLEEPSIFSEDLQAVFGVQTRTSEAAMLRYGRVRAGDVMQLRDHAQSVMLCKASIQKDGEVDVCIVAQRARLKRRVTNSAAEYELLDQVVLVPQHLVKHVCVWSPSGSAALLVLAPE